GRSKSRGAIRAARASSCILPLLSLEMPEPNDPTLLIADDDAAFRSALGGAMQRRGYDVALAANADEAESLAGVRTFEFALVDVRMPGRSGIELVEALRRLDEGTRIVVFTGYGTIANAVAAMRAGAFDYLMKPVDAATCERALLGVSGSEPAG